MEASNSSIFLDETTEEERLFQTEIDEEKEFFRVSL